MASVTSHRLWSLCSAEELTSAIEDALQTEAQTLVPDLVAAARNGDGLASAKLAERMSAYGDVIGILRREAEKARPSNV